MKGLIDWLRGFLPRYYHQHVAVSVLLAIVTLSPGFGAGFYAGREQAQYEQKGWFDLRGFHWPVVPMMALHIAERAFILWLLWKALL